PRSALRLRPTRCCRRRGRAHAVDSILRTAHSAWGNPTADLDGPGRFAWQRRGRGLAATWFASIEAGPSRNEEKRLVRILAPRKAEGRRPQGTRWRPSTDESLTIWTVRLPRTPPSISTTSELRSIFGLFAWVLSAARNLPIRGSAELIRRFQAGTANATPDG